MNKKLIYIFVFLVIGMFLATACSINQEEVGGRINKDLKKGDSGNKQLDVSILSVDCGTCGDSDGNSYDCSASISQGRRTARVTCNRNAQCSGPCGSSTLIR